MAATAAELRTYLEIQRQTQEPDAQDDWSEETPQWETIGGIQAKLEHMSGDERLSVAQMVAFNSYRITCRYRSDLKVTDRLMDPITGAIYNIDSLVDDRRRFLKIMATIVGE